MEYPVMRLCRLLGKSKQAYYKQREDSTVRKAALEAFALEYIRGIRGLDPGIGGKKMWLMYKRDFPDRDCVGRDWFEDILDRHGLKLRKKKRKPRTTDSSHGLPLFPNLAYDFMPVAVNQLWVTDITYVPVYLDDDTYVFSYLTLIMDAYSREIVGWSVGPTLETCYCIDALDMAFLRLNGVDDETIRNLVHHSDRGVQYASKEYVSRLRKKHVRISMTRNGDPKENAMAERINSTIKNEFFREMRFRCLQEVRDAVAKAVEFYNTRRPHMSIDLMTPEEAAKCKGELKKGWISYREIAIKNAVAVS